MSLVNVIEFGVNNIFRVTAFSGEVLLNWLHRRARSEGGFFIIVTIVTLRERVCCCDGRDEVFICLCSKRKNVTATRETVPWIIWALEIFVVYVIKIITFHLNPRLAMITLSCRVFIIDVNMANFAEVNCINNIYII